MSVYHDRGRCFVTAEIEHEVRLRITQSTSLDREDRGIGVTGILGLERHCFAVLDVVATHGPIAEGSEWFGCGRSGGDQDQEKHW